MTSSLSIVKIFTSTFRRLIRAQCSDASTSGRAIIFQPCIAGGLLIVDDTCGQHDLTIPACDPQRYLIDYGLTDHRSCRMNLFEMMAGDRIPYEYLPDPVNLFQKTPIMPDGRYSRGVSPSRAGDRVLLRALMDVIAVGSACPQDRTGSNGERITDIKFVVHD